MTPSERRHGERRSGRRQPRQAEESWFGAVGVGDDTQQGDDHWTEAAESRYAAGWESARQAEADSRFLPRQARRIVRAEPTAFQRIYRVFLGARAALGVALILTLLVAGAFGVRPHWIVASISLLYSVLALSMWLFPRLWPASEPSAMARIRSPQWLVTIGADILCFTALHALSGSSSFNYVALLVLPVLMAGVVTPRLQALATAGLVAMGLLGSAWLSVLAGGDAATLMTQAGLAGSGLFVITVLAGELAGRLAREELTAKGSLELARQQAQLNRLVIEEMQDGVLVVDRRGRVRAANPSARRLLAPSGLSRPWCWCSTSLPSERCGCASALRGAAMWKRLKISACCCSKTFAACRRAAGRKSWLRWAVCRPASHMKYATLWRPFRRPTRCCRKMPSRRRRSSSRAWWRTTSSA